MKRSIILYLSICSVGFIVFSCSKEEEPIPIPINEPNNIVLVNIQDSLNNNVPITDLLTQFPVDSLFGKTYQGGLIFYITTFNNFGLIVAPYDQGYKPWENPLNWTPTGANLSYPGGGQMNTTTIVNILGAGDYAAYLCDTLTINGYSDWYLPNTNEFKSMFDNLFIKNIGNFTDGTIYWTSLEYNNGNAYVSNIGTGHGQSSKGKDSHKHVRAARIFNF